jgi:serine/threonine protein kinase
MPQYSLEAEISQRKTSNRSSHSNKDFTHQELILLCYQMLNALSHLSEYNCSHNNVRPELICCDGRYNLNSDWYLCEVIDKYERFHPEKVQYRYFMEGRSHFMSPELFLGFCEGKGGKILFNPYNSDSWSLGLVLLSLGNLDYDVDLIYDKKNKRIDVSVLSRMVDSFRAKYLKDNKLLCQIVDELLTLDGQQRPTIQEVRTKIPGYEEILGYFSMEPRGLEQSHHSPARDVNFSEGFNR